MMPVVSILMSVYKESSVLLQQSVDSILVQTYKDFEFIIILDAPDNIEALQLLQYYVQKDSRIHLFINEVNLGLAGSLNRGLKECCGKYIARMDADDVSLPNRLEKQLAFLENNGLDLCGSYVQTIDENNHVIQNIVKVPYSSDKIQRCLEMNNCVFHPTWFARKEVFDKNNGYQGAYVEDYEFLLKAVQNGFSIGNVPCVLLKYRMSKNSISRSNLFTQYLSMMYLQRKYYKNIKITLEEFQKKHYTEKRALRFAKGNALLNSGLQKISDKKIISGFFSVIGAFFCSRFYTKKIFRYALQSIMS